MVEEPTDIGKEEVANLGLLMERGLDFRERMLEIPMLVGKGKRHPDLFKACGVLPLAQEPIGIQGGRDGKTPGIETRSRRPGKKPYPDALVRRETVSRKVPTPRGLEEIGRKPLNVTPVGAVLYISHKHGGILHSSISFAITTLIERNALRQREKNPYY